MHLNTVPTLIIKVTSFQLLARSVIERLTFPTEDTDTIAMIILLPIIISGCRIFCVESIPSPVNNEYCAVVARCELIKSRDQSKPRSRVVPRRLSNEYYRCREEVNATYTRLMREQDYCDGVKFSCRERTPVNPATLHNPL